MSRRRRAEAPGVTQVLTDSRPASLEMVTAVRAGASAEDRAGIAWRYIQHTFLPSVPREHQAWALGALIGGLAFDFAQILDTVPEAAAEFERYALQVAEGADFAPAAQQQPRPSED